MLTDTEKYIITEDEVHIRNLSMKKVASVEEMAGILLTAIHLADYQLVEHPTFGSCAIDPEHKNAYIVPAEVMQYLVRHGEIRFDTTTMTEQ